MTDPLPPIRVLAAGSLRIALPAIAEAFGTETGLAVQLSLGPAGLMRERIEAGEVFDLFASANMAHPRRLTDKGLAEAPVCFARNRLCLIAWAGLALTAETVLDVLADPSVRIGTSTPGDDPAGDYAFELFDLADKQRPGLGAALRARSRQLVGGRNTSSPPADRGPGWAITGGVVDVMVSYWSNARLGKGNPAFAIVSLPPMLSPTVDYGLALASRAGEGSRRLRDILLSESGRSILGAAGFSTPPASF